VRQLTQIFNTADNKSRTLDRFLTTAILTTCLSPSDPFQYNTPVLRLGLLNSHFRGDFRTKFAFIPRAFHPVLAGTWQRSELTLEMENNIKREYKRKVCGEVD
jgi:hypothetical protein